MATSSGKTYTRLDELPLHYKHPDHEGTLIFTVAVNDHGPIKGEYVFAIQKDNKEIIEQGVVHGISNLNKIRDEYIFKGWKRHIKPAIKVKDKNAKKEAPKPVEYVAPVSNPKQDAARAEAFARLRDQVFNDKSFF